MYRHFEAAQRRLEQDCIRDVTLAWHVANFSQAKKLPALQEVLRRLRAHSGRARTVEGHRAALQELSEQYGIPLRKAKPQPARKPGPPGQQPKGTIQTAVTPPLVPPVGQRPRRPSAPKPRPKARPLPPLTPPVRRRRG